MQIVIQLSIKKEEKALSILLRGSLGMIFPERIYVIGRKTFGLLLNAGIRFSQLSGGNLAP